VYGEQDEEYEVFRRARSGPLDTVLAREGTEMTVVPGRVHNFDNLPAQDALTGLICDWLSEHVPAGASRA
jgi:hypothetical protein